MLALAIIIGGVFSRLVFHAPNFTPVIALALFSGMYLRRSYTWSVPLFLMVISDIFIGLHSTLPFTWGSILIISALGVWLRQHKNWKNVTITGIFASVLFFVVTNLGAWFDIYPHTVEGMMACFVAAIPFFRNTLISTLLYIWLFYGAYELIAAKVKNSSWARFLLWA